jgi:hypothetical protein
MYFLLLNFVMLCMLNTGTAYHFGYVPAVRHVHGIWTNLDISPTDRMLYGPAYLLSFGNAESNSVTFSVKIMIVRLRSMQCSGLNLLYYKTNGDVLPYAKMSIMKCHDLERCEHFEAEHMVHIMEFDGSTRPLFAAIESNGVISNRFGIRSQMHKDGHKQTRGLSVCLSPQYTTPELKLETSDVFIRFVRYYRLAGVTKLFIFNHSWSKEMDHTVRQYNELHAGFLVIHQWHFGAIFTDLKRIIPALYGWPSLGHYCLFQDLALNYCLLEAQARGLQYSVVGDLDELIWSPSVPMHHNWLLHTLNRTTTINVGSWNMGSRIVPYKICDFIVNNTNISYSKDAIAYRSKNIAVLGRTNVVCTHWAFNRIGTQETLPNAHTLIVLHVRHEAVPENKNPAMENNSKLTNDMKQFC